MFSSLYIHVPFCNQKCDYCAFYSLGRSSEEQHDRYLEHLQRTFSSFHESCTDLNSVFIGGGTPTMLAPARLKRLLDMVRNTFALSRDCEWSCESTPESLTDETIETLAEGGVNRVSIGVQSFFRNELAAIGRRSPADNVTHAMDSLRRNGIANINVDLIFLIPGQTPDSFRESLRRAVELGATHVSTYALTLEERSILAKHLDEVDDRTFRDCWDAADDVLGNAGFHRYEISNFAREGLECRHNDDIWHGGTYLGCGPAATSFDGTTRWTQPSSLSKWLRGDAPERDELPEDARACELLAFGMRTIRGWRWKDFMALTGHDALSLRGAQLEHLCRRTLLEMDDDGARPTALGLIFNDDILEELI